jgi:hypothetical protein
MDDGTETVFELHDVDVFRTDESGAMGSAYACMLVRRRSISENPISMCVHE